MASGIIGARGLSQAGEIGQVRSSCLILDLLSDDYIVCLFKFSPYQIHLCSYVHRSSTLVEVVAQPGVQTARAEKKRQLYNLKFDLLDKYAILSYTYSP